MNKTLKKFLIFFIFLCIIALIVFAVELFVINRDKEPADPANTDTSAPVTTGSEPPSATGGTQPPGDGITPPDNGGEETPAVASGKVYELPVPGGATLILSADESLFTHEMMDMMGDMFIYSGGASELEISFIADQEALMLAPAFLDNYIDFTGSEFHNEGTSKIGKSEIYGEHVYAKNNGETYEAWLVDIEGGVLAFVVNYQDDTQKDALYKVLDSLEMVTA